MKQIYEEHLHKDSSFPFFFHLDLLEAGHIFRIHWHESVEILCFTEGEAQVSSDYDHAVYRAGDTAVINSGCLHTILPTTPQCRYYCLIVDKSVSDSLGIDVEKTLFDLKICDPAVVEGIKVIADGFNDTDRYAKIALKLKIMSFFTELTRNHSKSAVASRSDRQNKKPDLARRVVKYINENYALPLTTDSICEALGFSKYYVCHCFREVTGQTVTDYINYRRCSNARRLLTAGACNVTEAAEKCGFSNLSYFSKVYKRCLGVLPSEDVKK